MPARKWTEAQKLRQSMLIRTWKPWTASTGPKTAQGKQVASKNAVAYSCRELLREMTRTNRELVAFIKGLTPAPSHDRTKVDELLDQLAATVAATSKKASAPCTERVSETTP